MKLPLAVAGTLLVAACGAGGSPTASSTPTQPPPTAASSPVAPMLAVLEPGAFGQPAPRHTAVAIVRQDGYAAAKVKFAARPIPQIGNAAPVLQPEAVVAAGKVFFADGGGSVRSLDRHGAVAQVTRFPISGSQQSLAFAVDPGGSRLVASIFTWPPVHDPPPANLTDPIFGPGNFTLDLYTATSGGAPVRIRHLSWPQSADAPLPADVPVVVGWPAAAPVVTIDSVLGTQQPTPGRFVGHLAEIDEAGRPGAAIGGQDCYAVGVLADETVMCLDSSYSTVTVRARGGAILYAVPAGSPQLFQGVALAPDGKHAAAGNVVVGEGGEQTALPPQFSPEGWLDAATLVGVQYSNQGESDLQMIRLDHPQQVDDLGFKGTFVGPVAAA